MIEITNGEIVARPQTRWLQETDSAGHFHFPPQRPGDYLVITHDSGFVIFQPLNHKANRRIITLNPWRASKGLIGWVTGLLHTPP